MIVSSLVTSFSSRFSFLRSLIVPKFRWAYTLLARFLTVGEDLRLCCIMRTHSSIKSSLYLCERDALSSGGDGRTYASRNIVE